MKLFTIFGHPVSHSRSPLMHNSVFKKLHYSACYIRTDLKNGEELRQKFLEMGLSGANITVPHKEAAYQACDEIRGFASKVGVVNTIVLEKGKLIGYNTDADGFIYAIRDFKAISNVLVLGAGGTAKALTQRLKDEGYHVSLLNRSETRLKSYQDDGFETFSWKNAPKGRFDLLVNTTSAGLSDDALPAPQEILDTLIQQSSYCADAIYGKVTPFLKLCQKYNKPNIDGADMLLGQGVLANMLFTENTLEQEQVTQAMAHSFLL